MRLSGLGFGLSVLLAVSGCSAIVNPDGSSLGGDAPDGGGVDSGMSDSAMPPGDTGVPPGDTGVPPGDTGVPPDTGPPVPDGGECAPGATESMDCGLCGTATRSCVGGSWVDGACEGEGVCMPGESMSTACGTAVCTAVCEWGGDVCPPLDVMLLFDVTGSHNNTISTNADNFLDQLAAPLLAAGDVHIGVSYFADYPVDPYGRDTDIPFGGSTQPTPSIDTLGTGISSLPSLSGQDLPESGMEALYVLAGGTPHAASRPFDCRGTLEPGGCWRPGVPKVVIVVTDIGQHNAPTPQLGGDVLSPYDAMLGAPSWDGEVADALDAAGIEVWGLVRDRTGTMSEAQDGLFQLRDLVDDLGQDGENQVVGYRITTAGSPNLAAEIGTLADRIAADYL